jgi:predicted Zn-dependent protease
MAAAEVWEQLISEFKAATAQRSKQLFFATHPEPEERLTTLRKAAEASGAGTGERDRERYLQKVGPVRGLLIADELNLRQYGRSEVVFDRLLTQQDDDGALWFAKGEVFRLRAGADDGPRARQAYERALQTGSAPPETYRSLMLVELKAGARDRAQAAFDAYLALRPQAPDAASLRMLLTE